MTGKAITNTDGSVRRLTPTCTAALQQAMDDASRYRLGPEAVDIDDLDPEDRRQLESYEPLRKLLAVEPGDALVVLTADIARRLGLFVERVGAILDGRTWSPDTPEAIATAYVRLLDLPESEAIGVPGRPLRAQARLAAALGA